MEEAIWWSTNCYTFEQCRKKALNFGKKFSPAPVCWARRNQAITWTDWSLVLPKWTELVLCWGHLVHCEINHLFWEKCLPNGSTGWTRAHCRPIFVNVDLSHVAYSICNPITGHFLHSLPNSVACYKGQAFHLSFTSAHLQDPSQYCPNWCIASD